MKHVMMAGAAILAASTALIGVYVAAHPGASASTQVATTRTVTDATHPAVIELFQSQGCSSCPPALAVLDREADRPDVLALSFAVTYWDRLGWKDSYAKPAFTDRQWAYAHAQGRANVQTPQLIVNGRAAVLGSDQREVDRTIIEQRRTAGPEITLAGARVVVAASRAVQPATVWVVAYDPRTVQVPIRAGENGGRTLPHRNIVKQLTALGIWRGDRADYALPAAMPGLARAILVQGSQAGPIVAAARL